MVVRRIPKRTNAEKIIAEQRRKAQKIVELTELARRNGRTQRGIIKPR